MKRRDFLKATGATVLAGSAAAAETAPVGEELRIRTGPYLQNPAHAAMTVMWMTTQPCFGYVEYGATEQLRSVATAEADGLRQANT